MKKSRKWSLAVAAWSFWSAASGDTPTLDGARLGTRFLAHRHHRARHHDPVGGCHRQDRADHKVEIKSKANGIIERLMTDVDQVVHAGDVLVELDKENLRAQVREARANLQAARAALEASEAQLEKNRVEAEAPDVEFAKRQLRARPAAVRREARLAAGARRCEERAGPGRRTARAPRRCSSASARPRSREAKANVAQAAGRGRACRGAARQRDDPRADQRAPC